MFLFLSVPPHFPFLDVPLSYKFNGFVEFSNDDFGLQSGLAQFACNESRQEAPAPMPEHAADRGEKSSGLGFPPICCGRLKAPNISYETSKESLINVFVFTPKSRDLLIESISFSKETMQL